MLKVPAREVVKAMWKKQYVLIFNLLGSAGEAIPIQLKMNGAKRQDSFESCWKSVCSPSGVLAPEIYRPIRILLDFIRFITQQKERFSIDISIDCRKKSKRILGLR